MGQVLNKVGHIIEIKNWIIRYRSDSGYRYEFFQAKDKTLKIVARTRDNVDFLRKIGENTKPFRYGARNGTRTRDLLLGKETFYQLNYSRKTS